MTNSFELAAEWPHRHLDEYPDEIHISPRSAYFKRDGKLMVRRLEDLDDVKIADAYDQLAEEGVENPEL
ncbi:MAG: hypothetical protein LC687_01575 [Actinobacteria bacterium]|nr:hypothetical protein [Actinomycetota bacterium]